MEASTTDGVYFSVLDAAWNLRGHQHGYYRIRTTVSAIKYLAFLPLKHTLHDVPDDRGSWLGFSTVPHGDWNLGRLEYNEAANRFVLQSTETVALPQVKDAWHSVRVDESSLGEALPRDELQCALHVSTAIYPGQLGAKQVVVNLQWSPDDMFGVIQETQVYAQIHGHNIGPRFLAHVTENGERVCGYMLERPSARPATINDLDACKTVLAKLHSLKIAYGSLSWQSFLIIGDQALLHGFAGSFLTDNESLLQREMDSVEEVIRRGLPSTQYVSAELQIEISAIIQRDGGLHPEVLQQVAEYGKITLTKEEHQALLRKLQTELSDAQRYGKPFQATSSEGRL